MWIEKLAEKLRATLETMLGVAVPAAEVRVWGYAWGDIYSGGGYTDVIAFERPPLKIEFTFAFHELSGQCDGWKLRIDHARPDQVQTLREVFSPAQYTGHWRNGETPVVIVDGVEQRL